jgi:hypothetical protein
MTTNQTPDSSVTSGEPCRISMDGMHCDKPGCIIVNCTATSTGTNPAPQAAAPSMGGLDERALFEVWARKHTGMPAAVPFSWDAEWVKAALEGFKAGCALAQQAAPSPDYKQWYDAVTDACIVSGELPWDDNDAKGSLAKLIDWNVEIALDPKVSERAHALPSDVERALSDLADEAQGNGNSLEWVNEQIAVIRTALTQWNPEP